VSAAPLRAGIIGLGWIARVHVPALDAAADIELVAACDTDSERAEAIARPRGARAYTSWEEMLNREDLDALWVCTPPLRHRDPALAALASGIHVYLEKPIARTLDDAEAIVSAARSADAVCAVGYQWHASELIEKAREALAGQRVALLLGRNYGPVAGRPWFMDRAQGGGQILERGSHHIDLQRAIAGEISAVQAVAAREQLAQSDSEGSIDDAIGLVLHFESGALGSVYSAWSREGQPELYTTDILATDATITLEFGPDAFRISGLSRSRSLAGEFGDPMKRSFAGFLEAARTGDAGLVFCSPQDALRTLAIALACERALEDGGRIEVWS
jgi:myo-inositol 2-dehydrogenase / D-chiro-inositol 1-dehydrogenase